VSRLAGRNSAVTRPNTPSAIETTAPQAGSSRAQTPSVRCKDSLICKPFREATCFCRAAKLGWTFRTVYVMKSGMLDRTYGNRPAPQGPRVPADLVSELLMGMRLVGIEYRRIEISPPFGLRFGTVDGRA